MIGPVSLGRIGLAPTGPKGGRAQCVKHRSRIGRAKTRSGANRTVAPLHTWPQDLEGTEDLAVRAGSRTLGGAGALQVLRPRVHGALFEQETIC